MDLSVLVFYGLSAIILIFAYMVVASKNPVYSALYLVVTMISLAFVYFLLQAFFIAGVQLIVYAGAVMVLFVMVLMMFDLRQTPQDSISTSKASSWVKIFSVAWLWGTIASACFVSMDLLPNSKNMMSQSSTTEMSTKALAKLLYTEYLFSFELLGLLLLLIAVGAVSVSRIKGGTHVES